jgi:hypothetical protein
MIIPIGIENHIDPVIRKMRNTDEKMERIRKTR